MNVIYSLIVGILLSTSAIGQITITNEIFPAAGDTLKSVITLSPGPVDLLNAGGDQNWDFSMIDASTNLDVVFDVATAGVGSDDFPSADLVSFVPPNNERYVTVSATEVAELGFVGVDPVIQEFSIGTFYKTPYVLQRAPLNFGDTNSDQTEIVTTIDFDSIPDTLVMGLPISPDSLRVIVKISRESEVDAWGQLRTPAGSFAVLREKSVETRTTEVEAYTQIFRWQPVTDLIRNILPDPSLLDPIETEAYVFLSNEKKEPIASVTVDSNGMADRVQMYRANKVSTKDRWQHVDVSLSPNPTYGKTTLYYNGLDNGQYQLCVYDIIGNQLSNQSYYIDGSGFIKCNFSNLGKGTYLYSLKDATGEIITTKRLVILNP